MHNECKGCRSSRQVNNLSGICLSNVIPHMTTSNQCPCINCIVKMICDNKCDDFDQYLLTCAIIKVGRGLI